MIKRNEFLKLCQIVSAYGENKIPERCLVKYNDIVYFPYAYEMGFENGTPKHRAKLHDLKANAIIYADLERVNKLCS